MGTHLHQRCVEGAYKHVLKSQLRFFLELSLLELVFAWLLARVCRKADTDFIAAAGRRRLIDDKD